MFLKNLEMFELDFLLSPLTPEERNYKVELVKKFVGYWLYLFIDGQYFIKKPISSQEKF